MAEGENYPISNCDFGIVDYNKSDLSSLSCELPKDYHFRMVNGKFPEFPESLKKQYRVDDPFFITFDTLEQGWQKYQSLTKGKTITYGREVAKEFLSVKYKVNFEYLKYDHGSDIYRYDNVSPEPNSYWVDRKVGTLKSVRYEPKPCKEIPILRSNHFKEDVKKYVDKTLKPVWCRSFGDNEKLAISRTIVEAARITMIPLSPKIWFILVSSQNGKFDPVLDGIWTFSIVEFDSNKPILRSWDQQTFTDTFTWGMYGNEKNDNDWADPQQDLQLYGYCDINLDGNKDYVLRFSGYGSGTCSSKSILILSYTDKGLCEIVPSHDFFDFCGMDGTKPLFTYLHYGSGQLYQSFRNEAQVSTRWNLHILKVVEPRKDGNLYMVSYKYNTDLEELEQDIKSKHIYYLDLGSYEIIGKAKAAQKAFLETVTYTSPEQPEIVKVLLEKNHTMFVDCEEDLLPELKRYNPYP